jgi:hypothetical protein
LLILAGSSKDGTPARILKNAMILAELTVAALTATPLHAAS